ncbi:hypothetical protein D9758_011625 [Tetrapyrgos nigripes]|uniref:Carboxypeptidase n=1 Tax=Tetrapyrgos nigripes TaxID=182062 RepID=A0A8H5FS21_9AGAR|nr:hypothetical protein D9758_011625 [Tetrapyrgos nigripes]
MIEPRHGTRTQLSESFRPTIMVFGHLLSKLSGFLFITSVIASVQHPFQTESNVNHSESWSTSSSRNGGSWSDDGLFTPLESLSVLKTDEFTTMNHPAFPKYGVRIKKSDFCDNTVNAYTGYIDIEARHIFFYFFESRNDPAKDDVIFWTNGGPGCSSSMGLFFELGPCRVLDEDGPKFHPESWNSNVNIFFVDQPIGTGFSYADYGESVTTSEEAAKDIAAFVAIFFENFGQFKGRAFHMAGESYGGRHVPLFTSAVYDQNARLVEAGMTPINLTSMMIGNGLTDIYSMNTAYYEMTCTSASRAPVLDIATCVGMKQMLSRCEKWTKESCIDQYDSISCGAAQAFCDSAISAPFLTTGLNPYDISSPCEGGIESLCYPILKHISNFLDQPSTRKKLGVDPSFSTNFTSCNYQVIADFAFAQDILHPDTPYYVSALLERGVNILIYAGELDWVCNWLGNEMWTVALEWSGQDEFVKQPLEEWNINGKRAGKTRSWGKLTFATVEDAGHMAPYNKPKETLEMLKRWLTTFHM